MAQKQRIILTGPAVEQTIKNLAASITESLPSIKSAVLIGVQTRGVPLARRIARYIYEKTGHEIPVGILDITLYRDDVHAIGLQPQVKETELPVDIDDRIVILVDDVLFTGRTTRAALDQLVDFGRQKEVRLCVLVDRGHRELPIQPDFIGKTIATSKNDEVTVYLKEIDGKDQVLLTPKISGAKTKHQGQGSSSKGQGKT
jgi:pyrimidine operon attenuation protein/uracil phosphoribosyltransferase